jgi:hypothetical protein
MPNLDQPSVSEVVMPHFLFFEPGWRLLRVRYGDKPVVIGMIHVIDPGIGPGYLMKRKISAARQLRIVSVDFPDTKHPCRRATVFFFFPGPAFVLSC